jgi:hypothetical protein
MSDIFTVDTIAIAVETKKEAAARLEYFLSSKGLPEKPTEWLFLFLVRGEPKKVIANIRRQSNLILLQPFQEVTSLNVVEVKNHDVVICKLINPPDLETNPYYRSEIGLAAIRYLSYIACEFYRTTFDSRLIDSQIPRQPRDNYIQIKCEAFLWQKTWKMLEYMASFSKDESYTANNFNDLAIDSQLILIGLCKNLTEGKTKTDFINELQTQNGKMRELKGLTELDKKPFNPGSITHSIIEQAMLLAEKDGEFKKNYYKPMIDARTKLVHHLKNDHKVEILGGGRKKENRGRKPKK